MLGSTKIAAVGLPVLISVTEARRQLGNVSRTTLYALIARRHLKTIKLGARRMILSASLEALVKKSVR